MKSVRGLVVAGATLAALLLASLPAMASSQQPSSPSASLPSVASAKPGDQLWVSKLTDGTATAEAVSPDGTTVYVTGYDKAQNFETVAYSAATGSQLWITTSQLDKFNFAQAIVVSPDGATVYMVGEISSGGPRGFATVAYDAATGKQEWASRYMPKGFSSAGGIAIGPQGETLYVTGSHQDSENSQPNIVTIAYAAATGQRHWQHSYTNAKYSVTNSAALSPDGKTLYVTGYGGAAFGGASALTIAYQTDGTTKWVAQYKNPFAGAATTGQVSGAQIIAGPGGSTVYVVGEASNKAGHFDITTFAYRAATGKQVWLNRYQARAGGTAPSHIAVAPSGKSVIIAGPRTGGAAGYVLASYDASTGGGQWTRVVSASQFALPAGLVIDPQGTTVFVAESAADGTQETTAYAVADGSPQWTSSIARMSAAAITLSSDGTHLFVIGATRTGMATVAYQP